LKDHQFEPVTPAVIETQLADSAFSIVSLFESDEKDAFRTIGILNQISMGYLQWNWGPTPTLFTQLFRVISAENIDLAAPFLQKDLLTLKEYSTELLKKEPAHPDLETEEKAAHAVINSWETALPHDSLVKGVRKSVRTALGDWLASPPVRTAQRTLMEDYLQQGFALAKQWHMESGSQKPFDARLLAYFLDMAIFHWDTKGVWVEHVTCFRNQYSGQPKAIIDSVVAWLSSCGDFAGKLSRKKDAVKSASYWSQLFKKKNLDDEQLNLLVFALLVAQRLTGSEHHVKGYFQADALTGSGIITAGGYVGGKLIPDVMPAH
jgi:hypothetical protein